MDIYNDLTERIMSELAPFLIEPDKYRAKIRSLLNDYTIESKQELRKGNLSNHVQNFLNAKKIEGRSLKTLDNYKRYLTQFAAAVSKDAGKVSTGDIRNFIAQKDVKETSRNTILNILRSFFSWLTLEEIIKKNPMLKIQPRKTNNQKLRKALSVENLERIRNACETIKEKALIEFFFSTGCRLSEVAMIRINDIDFTQRTARVLGKGGKERIVYFSIKARLLLMEYLKRRKGESQALFTNDRAPYEPMSRRSMQKVIKNLGERAFLLEKVHPHLLRHTFATISLNNGMDITVIQALLGHSQLSTTQIYASISEDNVAHEYQRYIA